ncbi:MAG TPA: amidohydrolase family protein [Terriglobales bacterium]|nr:amidohydrolase family protein [Terriglobales bacterium]
MSESTGSSTPPMCQPPNLDLTPPKFVAPPGAWDCHLHIIGPQTQYRCVPNRSYTPVDADVESYRCVTAALRLDHAVVVQPSFYGTDNRCTCDAILASNGRWRGVAVVDPTIKESELAYLHETGIRGVRINLLFKGGLAMEVLEQIACLIQPWGWHVQLLVDGRDLPGLASRLRKLPVPFVVDHMGHMPTSVGVEHPGFQTLLQLAREGCWVKLSGPYRISGQPYPYDDVVPFAHALVEAAPARMVWGTDWPHPAVSVPIPRGGDLMDLVPIWIPDAETRHRVLVENPARLYGFKPANNAAA